MSVVFMYTYASKVMSFDNRAFIYFNMSTYFFLCFNLEV
jgi:hypothetical protein